MDNKIPPPTPEQWSRFSTFKKAWVVLLVTYHVIRVWFWKLGLILGN